MGSNRKDDSDHSSLDRPHFLQAAETLRSVAAVCANEKGRIEPRGEEKISVFWRVFGGTLLSIGALIVMTVYQQFSTNLNDLRAAINHLSEVQVDLIKKDDLNGRTNALWASIKESGSDLVLLKTKTALLESQAQSLDKERKELHDKVEQLSERLAALEGRQRAPVSPTLKVPAMPAGAGE